MNQAAASLAINYEAGDGPLVRRILGQALDRLDNLPTAARTNAIRINLDATMAPEIHDADSLAMREVAWAIIDGLVIAEWCRLGYRLHRRHGAREERQPYLDIVWNDDVEDLVRTKLGRPRKAASYSAQWRALLERSDPSFTEPALAKLASAVIEVSGRPVEEVFSRFLSIRSMASEPLLLREVSSRVFWGLSKLLDGRAENVAMLLGVDECPFPEQPIVLNVHVADPPSSLLFVENHVSFERLKQRNDLHGNALIFCSGFRGAARRLREPGGASLYYTRNSPDASIAAFETALFSARDVPTFFWGDLDYSGMAILASLRLSFPQAQAWQPGYEPMLVRLVNNDGHSPAESGKERQRPIDRTGCTYADETLIPALRAHGCFVDQE
jgi:hypothetical protein